MNAYIAAWLLIYSWTDCGSGASCLRFEQSVPSIATQDDCIALGKNVTSDKRDRPSFRCISYAGAPIR